VSSPSTAGSIRWRDVQTYYEQGYNYKDYQHQLPAED
jgi:hypothetical protein